jgi:homoserine kinase type II
MAYRWACSVRSTAASWTSLIQLRSGWLGPSWLRCTTHWRSILRLIAPPGWTPLSNPLAEKINGWLDSCPDHVPAAAQDALRRLVADADPDPLPTQLVHGDYRSANILVAGPGIAAVIDFEEARFDNRIDELARSAVMLGTRFRDWGPVSPEVRTAFLDGYQSERRMTAAEATWWDALVLWYSLVLTPAGEDPTGWGQAALDQLRELS